MNFFKRAIRNIQRNSIKTILLVLTFFLIGNLVIIGLGINYASENAKKLTRMKMTPIIYYTVDYDSFYAYVNGLSDEEQEMAYQNYPQAKIEDFKKLIDNEHVKAANAIQTWSAFANDFDYVLPEGKTKEDFQYSYGGDLIYYQDNIQLTANGFDNMIELENNTYEIVEGNFYSQNDLDNKNKVCLITKDLAAYNNIKVGDYITISFVNNDEYYKQMGIDANMELKVIGLYSNNTVMDDSNDWMKEYPEYMPENNILMPSTVLVEKRQEIIDAEWEYWKELYPDDEWYNNDDYKEDASDYYSRFVMLLDDPLYVEPFMEEQKENLPEFMMFDANNEQFETFAKPLDTMSLFSNIIIWIVVINAVVIISLVSALTLKSREKEIGIFLSMGITKFKIISQLFIELAIVAIIGFSFAVITGCLSSRLIGQAVLEYQLTNNENEIGYYYTDEYFTEITQEDMLSEYEVIISPLIIGEIYALGLGVTFIATMIPAFMIMRFNPKKILTDTY